MDMFASPVRIERRLDRTARSCFRKYLPQKSLPKFRLCRQRAVILCHFVLIDMLVAKQCGVIIAIRQTFLFPLDIIHYSNPPQLPIFLLTVYPVYHIDK